MTIRVAIETLGCKLNQAESETLARQFASAGCVIVEADEKADVYILNTCTVTHVADRKSRQLLRAARRRNPQALIVATGCYANRSEDELFPEVDLVVKNEDKRRLWEIIAGRLDLQHAIPLPEAGLRTRSFIKVQDGCNRRCAYCIVPLVRGRGKSVPVSGIIAEMNSRTADGCKEVVLTGTEIGSYLSDGLDIRGLLEKVLAETTVERLRVSSLQPYEITPALLELWQNPRLCPHFHISLQSGSDSVLKRMQRGYNAEGYEKAVCLIRGVLPEAAITTDIIVGFPGETHEEFQESLDFCEKVGFARIHVFPYSARPGTAAAGMPGKVEARVKKGRSAKMLALAKEGAREFRSAFLGRTLEVLWEQKSVSGLWCGYTASYIRVYARAEIGLTNMIAETKLVKIYRDGVWGKPIDKEVQNEG